MIQSILQTIIEKRVCINLLSTEIISNVNGILCSYVEDFSEFSLNTYKTNKAQFYEDFGQKLIVSKDINLDLTKQFKENRMKHYVTYCLSNAISNLILENGVDGFFENKIMRDLNLTDLDGNPVKIKSGMKLSKAFKFFISNPHLLERNQTEYSKALGQSLSGELCLSIHPLDYLSMSMNSNGWSSCQSLDGDYAAGTLALMSDEVTLVAYLHNGSNDNCVFENGSYSGPEWNSKKWRVLVHINKDRDLVLFAKHYPFTSRELEQAVLDMIKEIYPDSKFSTIEKATSEIMSTKYEKHYGSVHYSDLRTSLGSMNFGPYSAIGEKFSISDSTPIVTGTSVPCCKCGCTDIEEPMEYCCYGCSNNSRCCDCCGDCGFHEDDMVWVNRQNELICQRCYDETHSHCEECDEIIYNDDTRYLEETGCVYCDSCYYEVKLEFEEDEDEEREDD